MKKTSVFIIFVIMFAITFSACSFDNKELEDQKKVVEKGRELLIQKYPEFVTAQSDLLAYFYNGVWHVQTIVPNEEEGDYININVYDEHYDVNHPEQLLVCSQLNNLRYVKLNEQCTKVLGYGSFDSPIMKDKYILSSDDEIIRMCRSLQSQIFSIKDNQNESSDIRHYNDEFCAVSLGYSYERGYGYVVLRKSDGMILFIEDPLHSNHTKNLGPALVPPDEQM